MVTVALAGEPTEAIDTWGKCTRTERERMPMLMLIPRLSPSAPADLADSYPPTHQPLHLPPPPPSFGDAQSWQSLSFHLSGAAGAFSMIGLGDIVLPALALAFARRMDLALADKSTALALSVAAAKAAAKRLPPPHAPAAAGCVMCPRLDYYGWAVMGYALGLAITLAANTYGWTFNGVQGQPALMYLVPCVLGSQLLVAWTRGELLAVWTGSPLPQSSSTGSRLLCNGCRVPLHLDAVCWSDPTQDVDFCQPCYAALPAGSRPSLTSMRVRQRCCTPPDDRPDGGPIGAKFSSCRTLL